MFQSEKILKELTESGFSVVPDFLSISEVDGLREELRSLQSQGAFHEARIGQGAQQVLASNIRRDAICWLEPGVPSGPQTALWNRLEILKSAINHDLFLGLWEIEGHYAIYKPGGYYDRHFDRFKSDDARTVSVVLYLNSEWKEEDGGELALFVNPAAPEQPLLVAPRGGTAVFFFSDRVEHQVQTTNRERLSFAGWMKRRS
jgi:SM-20-related protein